MDSVYSEINSTKPYHASKILHGFNGIISDNLCVVLYSAFYMPLTWRKLRLEFGVKMPKDLFTESRTWYC